MNDFHMKISRFTVYIHADSYRETREIKVRGKNKQNGMRREAEKKEKSSTEKCPAKDTNS